MPLCRKNTLEFCLRGGEWAIEVLEDCPAIALLLAERIQRDPSMDQDEQIAVLAACNRTEILRYCYYPAQPWVVQVLSRIPARHSSPYLLADLAEIICSGTGEKLDILRHLPQISGLVVFLLKNEEIGFLVDRNFYLSAATYPRTDSDVQAEYLLGEIARIAADHEVRVRVPRICRVRDLPDIHDQMAERFVAVHNFFDDDTVFQDPPVPEPEVSDKNSAAGIYALQTARDLYFEGERMRHCIASCSKRIALDKNVYAYHVSSPAGEEATILIIRDDITWRILEIRGVANRKVSKDTRLYVESWLNNHNEYLAKLQGLRQKGKDRDGE